MTPFKKEQLRTFVEFEKWLDENNYLALLYSTAGIEKASGDSKAHSTEVDRNYSPKDILLLTFLLTNTAMPLQICR